MSLLCLLKIEFIKQKRGFLWKTVFIIPLVALCLFSTYLYIKYNSLISLNALKQFEKFGAKTKLDILLFVNHQGSLWFMLSSLIFILAATQINFMEHKENCWKSVLSLPLNRTKVYLSKWLVVFIFCSISIVLNSLGFVIILFIFKLGNFINGTIIFKYIIFQILCSLSIISFQQFISSYFKNLLVPLTIAFIGITNTFMFWQSNFLSNIIPYMPTLRALPLGDGKDAKTAVISSILSGILWLTIGILEFKNKDIK
ncbi:ABC transporter permease [Clostridium sporogenes]